MASVEQLIAVFERQAAQQRALLEKIKETVRRPTPPHQTPSAKTRRLSIRRSPAAAAAEVSPPPRIKKRLSFSSSAKKRRIATPDKKQIRQDLGNKLKMFDKPLLKGEFQRDDDPNTFDKDKFEAVCVELIADTIGSDCDDSMPEECFRMCLSIAKKRRYYLLRKHGVNDGSRQKAKKKAVEEKEEAAAEENEEAAAEEKEEAAVLGKERNSLHSSSQKKESISRSQKSRS